MCDKAKHQSKEDANHYMMQLHHSKKRAKRSRAQPIRTYYCNECQAWHLTSSYKYNKKRLRNGEHDTNTTQITTKHGLKRTDSILMIRRFV